MINRSKLSSPGAFLFLALTFAALAPLRSIAADPVYQWSTFVGRASAGSDDGAAADARFDGPRGLAMDAAGNLYIADKNNHTIRKISATGTVSTLAGTAGQSGSTDGSGAAARFNSPEAVAVDSLGNVFVADRGNYTVRKITAAGLVTTLAGTTGVAGTVDGPAVSAQFWDVRQVAVDGNGVVYVTDFDRICRIADGQVTTLYHSHGTISVPDAQGGQLDAAVTTGGGLAAKSSGELYFTAGLTIFTPSIGYAHYPAILKRTVQGEVSLVHGGPRDYASFDEAAFSWVALDAAGNMAVMGARSETPIWLRVRTDGATTEGFLPAIKGYSAKAYGMALSVTGDIYYSRVDNAIFRQPTTGDAVLVAGTPRTAVAFDGAWSLAVDAPGNVWVAVVDISRPAGETKYSDGGVLNKITPTGIVTTVVPLRFTYSDYGSSRSPIVAADGARGVYFLHGLSSQAILTRIAEDGTATDVMIGLKPTSAPGIYGFYAVGLVADSSGNPVVPDSIGHAIWRRNTDGTWAVLAGKDGETGRVDGTGGDARFGRFLAITPDRNGNFYVIDRIDPGQNNPPTAFIRKISPAGVVTTVGPDLFQPVAVGAAEPSGLAVDSKGAIYVTYAAAGTIWRLQPGGKFAAIGGKAGAKGVVDGIGDAARFVAPGLVAIDAQDRLLVLDTQAGVLRRGELLTGPVITTQPQSVSVASGGSAQFSVVASGTPVPTYQWNFNGAAISGATTASYSISGVQAANAGSYTVTISNSQGSTTSSTASLTIAAAGGGSGAGTGGSTGGGGGAPGVWFYTALAVATFARFRSRFFRS